MGYIRVSGFKQNLDGQLQKLKLAKYSPRGLQALKSHGHFKTAQAA